MRSYVVVADIEYFQMGIESYQRKINHTPPMLACVGIQKVKGWTCFTKPDLGLCCMYVTDKKQKRLFRVVEVDKFSSGTLLWILKRLERIKKKVENLQKRMTAMKHQMLNRVVNVIKERLTFQASWRRMEQRIGSRSWPHKTLINRRPE